jgi:tol-pal system protein YbgF
MTLPLPAQDMAPSRLQLAQVVDPRVTALEEEVRRLNGTIEELNFQILQMQEQIRRMQEDNEFRFQQLEERRSDAAGSPSRQGQARSDRPAPGGGSATAGSTPPAAADAQTRTFGTITFDEKGNPRGAGIAEPAPDSAQVAALPRTDDPDELYRNAYDYVLSGDYAMAEAAFREHIERFPDDPRTADARFWLGEAVLAQDRYRDAAEIFLAANQAYPNAAKAPDMLLKLGVALAAMNQRDIACATFVEIAQRYPNASAALQRRVAEEKALAGC